MIVNRERPLRSTTMPGTPIVRANVEIVTLPSVSPIVLRAWSVSVSASSSPCAAWSA
jgi:hypothetical protein